MKRAGFTLLMVMIFSFLSLGQVDFKFQRVIVKLKNSGTDGLLFPARQNQALSDNMWRINRKFNVEKVDKVVLSEISNCAIYLVNVPIEADIDGVIREYAGLDEVEYAELDHVGMGAGMMGFVPNDQYYSRQWGLNNNGTFSLLASKAGADIDMENAWTIEQGSSDVVVAIIDSGAKLNHPELSGRIWENKKEIPANGIDDDNNGFVDDINGWDFANNDNIPTDDHGHGSNVAGIIGANGNNGIGYAGVDLNCKLMILKGLDKDNKGFYSWWISAIYYAVDNGAKVINMSLGGSSASLTLTNAINYALNKNVTVVVSMMNFNSNEPYYPAAIPGVIAVGATNPDDKRAVPFFWSSTSGSSFGSHISVVAPGNYIFGLSHTSDISYGYYWGGTSQAAPHVSGLASLLLAQNKNRTPAQIKSIIESTAEDMVGLPGEDVSGWDQYYGYGRINAYNALTYMANGTDDVELIDFNLFPNPSDGFIRIIMPSDSYRLEVVNAAGQVVGSENVLGKTEHDLEINQTGLYLVRLSTDRGVYTKKVVVKK